jgi:hypothetical protein
MKPIKTMSVDLIHELDKQYPSKCPDPEDSERVIWMKAGQRLLVDNLLSRIKTTEDNVLGSLLTEE